MIRTRYCVVWGTVLAAMLTARAAGATTAVASFLSNDGVTFSRQNTINFRFSLVLAAVPE